MIKYLFYLMLISPVISYSQIQHQIPCDVKVALAQAGKNGFELEKVIEHYQGDRGNELKLKAAYFLIANMPIHYSIDRYWVDSLGIKISYEELFDPNLGKSLSIIDSLNKKFGKIRPIIFKYKDIDTITANYLIENIDLAFEEWNNKPSNLLNFDMFCEYILPYRISCEPLQNWRGIYKKEFYRIKSNSDFDSNSIYQTASSLEKLFINSFGFEEKRKLIPRFGAVNLMQFRKGACEDITDFKVFALRSQGITAAVEIIPEWATASGRHFFASSIDSNGKFRSIDMPGELEREPGKVLRTTFSIQKETIAAKIDTASIPEGPLREQNYLDVTSDYWKVEDLECTLDDQKSDIAFICVFNYMNWKPVWWGNVLTRKVNFTKMPTGVVYLPTYYRNGKNIAAGNPIAAGVKHKVVLKPDTVNLRKIVLPWQDKYLIYKPGKVYKLYYWDYGWKLSSSQVAAASTLQLSFENVPTNALLLLVPDYSKGKERPFIVTEQGERVWF